ncbi:MAG TPA: BatA domain-containing protein [Gemmatimonadaceae bacterium]|nr:BatA domain-containing protein [Gemmatimonadaceae bacterium]
MGFLVPAFFYGLAALAVPVLVHLINRERKVAIQFPSLMFLQKIPYKSVRRQKLRHLLLLALRCLALAILVAAFTRPFLPRHASPGVALTGARERVVLLDRSYSMGYGDHWMRAQDAARAAMRELGSGDRASLVLFANDAAAATPPTGNHADFDRAVSSATLSAEGTRLAPALKLASQIFAGSNLPRREVLIISDFQNVGWNRRDDVRLPPGTTVTTVDLSGAFAGDMSVSAVKTDRDTDPKSAGRDRVTVTARLTNTGTAPRTVDAALELGGRPVETKRVTVPASGAVQVRFLPTGIPSGATRGTVRIPHDALPANDAYHFTLAPDEAVSVLVIEPPRARANQSLFLSRALAIGDRPTFHVTVKSADAITTADLQGRALIVLNEVPPPAGAVGAKLRELIAGGAGLLVVPGDLTTDRWPAEWRALIPLRLGAVVDRTASAGGTLASVNYGHPVFELFSAPRSGDFSTARLFRYRAMTAPGDSGVLARFDDGSPALVEGATSGGKVLVWGSTLDEYWTDLPLQPVFLPFIHELAKYAGRYADPRAWYTAGEVLDLSRHGELTAAFQVTTPAASSDASPLVLESPSGKRLRLSAGGAAHLAELREQGFYELRGPTTPVGSGRPIAVNVDLSESDLSHFDPRELVAAVSAPAGSGDVALAGGVVLPEELERRQTMWWYLLLAALIFMAAETVLSNRLSRASS